MNKKFYFAFGKLSQCSVCQQKKAQKSADVCRADFYMHTKIGYPSNSQWAKIRKMCNLGKVLENFQKMPVD